MGPRQASAGSKRAFDMEEEHPKSRTQKKKEDRALQRLGEELLTPTKIYVDTIQSMIKNLPVLGLSHITGGGFYDNVPRIVPEGMCARVDTTAWTVPPLCAMIRLARSDALA